MGQDVVQFSIRKPLKKHLPKEASIFFAEICGINLALKLVSTSNKENFIMLQSLKNTKLDKPYIVKLLTKLNFMSHYKELIFCWIPNYIGI